MGGEGEVERNSEVKFQIAGVTYFWGGSVIPPEFFFFLEGAEGRRYVFKQFANDTPFNPNSKQM